MKIKSLAGIFFFFSLFSCSNEEERIIQLSNPLNVERINEVVELKYSSLEEILGKPADGNLYVFESGGHLLPAQYVDYEKDGVYDDVLIEISLKANESLKINCTQVPVTEYPEFPQKTNIRFTRHADFNEELEYAERLQSSKTEISSKEFLMEGPAWENDLIGFRNYFDLRNGMDIFGKTTRKMALDNVGVNKHTVGAPAETYGKTYHELNDWGMDILKVGNSLGAGSVALFVDDSLYRIGDNGKGIYELVYEGPLRSEFRFSFPNWKAGEKTYNITQYVRITAGSYSYKSSLFIDKAEPGTEFTTGIVNLHSDKYYGESIGDEKFLLYSHDKQAFDTSYLFMGILADKERVTRYGQTREEGAGITQTFFLQLKTEAAKQLDYRFYAFWERENSSFAEMKNNLEIIQNEVLCRQNPIELLKK